MNQQLISIAAEIGTPCFVYDADRIAANFKRLENALGAGALHYAVKANGNLAVLKLLNKLGAGFDVVSWGEAARVLAAGAQPSQIVFAGVGKRDDEIAAALDHGVAWLNIESAQELRVVSDMALARHKTARVALRINPAVDPHTHQYLATGKGSSKFGITIDQALALVAARSEYPGVVIDGVHAHIGSQLFEVSTYVQTMTVLLEFVAASKVMGMTIGHVDMGGGFGVDYRDANNLAPIEEIAAAILPMAQSAGVQVQFEPGRYIVADAGRLLTRVLFTKENGGTNYAVVDAAMNDLIRPTLYQAFHGVSAIRDHVWSGTMVSYDVVGPICESGDWLAHHVVLPCLERGDLLAFEHAGAYGMSMSSNYNTRPRAAEVMTEGTHWRVIRKREPLADLWALEFG